MVTASSQLALNNSTSSASKGKRFAIAIDGPAGAGKSTVAQLVARDLGYLYIDTGAMYRAATWVALERRVALEDEEGVIRLVESTDIDLKPPDDSSRGRIRVFVNGADVTMAVRSRLTTRSVSQISAIRGVRTILVKNQQRLAEKTDVVMDGRDIGTVVLPNADLKVFLIASPKVRAERRHKELTEIGQASDFETILKDIEARDHFDSHREVSPLRQAPDAILINTDDLTIAEVVQRILELARAVSNKS